MLTRRGWSLLGATIGLYAGGRIIGLGQLDALAAMGAVLLVTALVWTRLRSIDVSIRRRVPERLTVGADGRVDLVLLGGARRTPALQITDSFDSGRRTARFRTPALPARGEGRAAYRVPTETRGRHTLGPLRVALVDPFGVSRRMVETGGINTVLVYPRVYDILAPPETTGLDMSYEVPPRRRRPQSGTEFLTLREYQLGDDLRRVHWASTARRDELMIRQDESQRRAPNLVVLDVRRRAHDSNSFERAVEAAASIVRAIDLSGRPCELYASTGERLGRAGSRHLASVLDELAVVEPRSFERFAPTLLRRRAALVIAVTGRMRGADQVALRSLSAGSHGLIVVDASARSAGAAASHAHHIAAAHAFPERWNQMVLQWHGRPTRRLRRSHSPV